MGQGTYSCVEFDSGNLPGGPISLGCRRGASTGRAVFRPQWDPPRSFEQTKNGMPGMLDCKEGLEFRGRVEHWNPQIIYIYIHVYIYIYAIFLFPNMKYVILWDAPIQ